MRSAVVRWFLSRLPWILVIMPFAYVGVLLYRAWLYRPYYDDSLFLVPFDFTAVMLGFLISILVLLLIAAILNSRVARHRNMILEHLGTGEAAHLFNSDLFAELSAGQTLEAFEELGGGYSGARVFKFRRQGSNVPHILKLSSREEIENEYQKFRQYVRPDEKMVILNSSPEWGKAYTDWGSFAVLEYRFAQANATGEMWTFGRLYRQCANGRVRIETIESIIENLFAELIEDWRWSTANLARVNLYAHYYPFTRKFGEIRTRIRAHQQVINPGLQAQRWDALWQCLNRFLDREAWQRHRRRETRLLPITKACIHGDLNSRNVLVSVNPHNLDAPTVVRFIDFSHTGNGLTRTRTREYREEMALAHHQRHSAPEQLPDKSGHVTDDFCRLEADIKFTLTDLGSDEAWRRVWLLENLLQQQGLAVRSWSELLHENLFATFLAAEGLDSAAGWRELASPEAWRGDKGHRFELMWRSVKKIRDSQRPFFSEKNLPAFWMSLLQSGLTMSYWEEERFYDADLQKLYLLLSSALLCEKLSSLIDEE